MRFKKSFILILSIVLLLVVFRLALPSIVKRYVNKSLNDLPGYSGHVEDVGISLYRGAYALEGLVLEEEKGDPENPFLRIEKVDLSVEWKSLFKGKLVGEVVLMQPQLTMVATSTETESKATSDHWTEVVKDLMPITINRLEIVQGRLAYLDFEAEPDIDLHIDSLQLVAFNLANAEDSTSALPSTVDFRGRSVGNGVLEGDMKVNALKEIPDFDLKMKLTRVDLRGLNDFIDAYGKFDVERGRMDLFTEVSLRDGQLDGYVKPFFENVKVLNWKKDEKEDGFFRAAWEAVAGLFTEVAENQPRDQVATIVPIKGNVNSPDVSTWVTVKNVLRHAFIDAFNKGLEGTVASEE